MADMKIPASLPLVPARSMSGARAEAIRNAQKAFFEAAMAREQLAVRAAPKPASRPQAAAPAEPEPETAVGPQRYLRPGSRLDIKV